MNESFNLRVTQNGRPLTLTESDDGSGLIIDGETDAFPRRFYLEFDSPSSVTRFRMRAVQRLNGWHPWEFKLQRAMTDDGCVSFRGVNPFALPPGHYWIRPSIEDLILEKGKRIKVRIHEGEETPVEIRATIDPRRAALTKRVPEWDKDMRRVAKASTLDDKPVWRWLDDSNVRERRKACLLNILAGLRGTSFEGHPLLSAIDDVFFAGVDRVYTRASADLYRVVVALANDPKRRFYAEGAPRSAIHQKLLERASERFGVNPKDFTLESYRSEGGPSAQIVFGIEKHVSSRHLVEIDVDLGNPLQDVRGFVVHLGELLDAGRTDHLELRKSLAKRKEIKPFLYYEVRKS